MEDRAALSALEAALSEQKWDTADSYQKGRTKKFKTIWGNWAVCSDIPYENLNSSSFPWTDHGISCRWHLYLHRDIEIQNHPCKMPSHLNGLLEERSFFIMMPLLKVLNLDGKKKKMGLNLKNHIVSFSCLSPNFFYCFFTFSPRIAYFVSNQSSLVFSLQSLVKTVFS